MSGMELLEQYNVIQSEGRTTVSGYSDNDYTVNNVRIFGSVFLVPTGAFLWNVQRFEDINKESLKIVEYLNPTPGSLQFHFPLYINIIFRSESFRMI